MTAARAALLGTTAAAVAARGATFVAIVATVAHVFQEAFESAKATAIQVPTVLAAIGAAGVVAVAIARISRWRVTLPIAVIGFAAGSTLIDFAAELRRVPETTTFATAASTAAVAAGIAIIATAADETIHHPVFVVAAMATAIGDNENPADDSETSELMHEHGELPPGNLEPRNRWKRLPHGGSKSGAAKGRMVKQCAANQACFQVKRTRSSGPLMTYRPPRAGESRKSLRSAKSSKKGLRLASIGCPFR